jgi:hypothetical protein
MFLSPQPFSEHALTGTSPAVATMGKMAHYLREAPRTLLSRTFSFILFPDIT